MGSGHRPSYQKFASVRGAAALGLCVLAVTPARPMSAVADQEPELTPGAAQQVTEAFGQAVAELGIPGGQAAVVRGRKMLWSGEAGILDGREPVVRSDRFVIASSTKPIIASLAMQLVDRGLLALSDTLDRFQLDLPHDESITVRMLLAHRSGLAEYFDDPVVSLALLDPHHPWTRAQILDGIRRQPPRFDPGERYEYTNSNYVVLGEIIERATGRPIESLLSRRIAGTLGLGTLSFREHVGGSRIAHGHQPLLGLLGPSQDQYELAGGATPTDVIGPVWTDGGIATSARNLARFTSALFAGEIVSHRSVARMTAPTGPGLGLETSQSPTGGRLYGHPGAYGGFSATLSYDRRTKTSVVALANTGPLDAAVELARRVRLAVSAN